MQPQCLLAATAQNIKKIASLLSRTGSICAFARFEPFYRLTSLYCTAISSRLAWPTKKTPKKT
jgi:hypothetical protein